MFENIFKPKYTKQSTLSWKDKNITIILDSGHGKDVKN